MNNKWEILIKPGKIFLKTLIENSTLWEWDLKHKNKEMSELQNKK